MLLATGNSRKYIKDQINDVLCFFKFAVGRELIDESVLRNLSLLRPLRRGEAPNREKRATPPLEDVLKTADACDPVDRTMIRIQLLTGCRPGELFLARANNFQCLNGVHVFQPDSHKTLHHGKQRKIVFSKTAMSLVRPLMTGSDHLLFLNRRGRPFKRSAVRFMCIPTLLHGWIGAGYYQGDHPHAKKAYRARQESDAAAEHQTKFRPIGVIGIAPDVCSNGIQSVFESYSKCDAYHKKPGGGE